MPIRPILQLGDPRLRQTCAVVSDPSAPGVHAVVRDLADTLAQAREATGYGRAIAAPQIGVLERIVVLRLPGEPIWALVNPVVVARSAETYRVWDACLSFLCIFMQVERHRTVTVRYSDLDGVGHEVHAGAARDLSELLQHELDHLDGILCLDRVPDLTSVCTREEFERRYRADSPYADAGGAA